MQAGRSFGCFCLLFLGQKAQRLWGKQLSFVLKQVNGSIGCAGGHEPCQDVV